MEYATKHLSVGPTERLFARRPSSRAQSDVRCPLPGHPADAGFPLYVPSLALAFRIARAFGRTVEEVFEPLEEGDGPAPSSGG